MKERVAFYRSFFMIGEGSDAVSETAKDKE